MVSNVVLCCFNTFDFDLVTRSVFSHRRGVLTSTSRTRKLTPVLTSKNTGENFETSRVDRRTYRYRRHYRCHGSFGLKHPSDDSLSVNYIAGSPFARKRIPPRSEGHTAPENDRIGYFKR